MKQEAPQQRHSRMGNPANLAESTPSCERTGHAWGVHDRAGWLLSISTKT
jgi:hypothetical protein